MRNFFNLDSRFMRGLTMLGDYIFLNVIFLVTCIPVVTIGASKTALYRVMFDMIDDKGNLYKKYFTTWWHELWTTLPLWLIKLAGYALLVWSMFLVLNNAVPFRAPVIVGLCIILALWGIICASIFPQIAQFRSTRRDYFRNAVYIALTHFGQCFLTAIFDLLPIIIYFFISPDIFVAIWPAWMLIYFSLTVNVSARIWRKPFQKMIDNYEQSQEK